MNADSLPQKAVYIFWHGKMLAGWWALRKMTPGAMVSMSKDGELLASLLESWDYKLFRGSSSSGGKAALSELSVHISNGNPGVLTPDGPRGPAGFIKNGALILAKENNAPMIPVKIKYERSRVLERSWDNFEIPYPFSKCTIVFGKPVYYDTFLESEALDDFKSALASNM